MFLFVARAAKTVKEFVRPQHSLDRLKSAGQPRIGISPPTVYVPSPNQNGNIQKKHFFCSFVSL